MIGGIAGGAATGVLIVILGLFFCFRRRAPSPAPGKIDLTEDYKFQLDSGRVDPYPMLFPEPVPARAPVAPDAWKQNFKPQAAAESVGYAPEQFTAARRDSFLNDSGPSTGVYRQEQVTASRGGTSQTNSTLKTSTAGNTPSTSTNKTASWAASTTTAATAPVAEPPAQPILHEVDVGPVRPIRLPPMYNEAWRDEP